jgi:DNA-binding NtrC family response regulator
VSNSSDMVVLLAKDDAAVRTLATALLSEGHLYAHQACVADGALWVAGTHEEIDLLLSNVEVNAGLSGIKLGLHIVEESSSLRVLVMSGSRRSASHLPA